MHGQRDETDLGVRRERALGSDVLVLSTAGARDTSCVVRAVAGENLQYIAFYD